MGCAGVAVAAAGAHLQGGDTARIAAEFLLVHGAAVFAMASVDGSRRGQVGVLLAAGVLAVSASLFGADLALASLAGLRPLPAAAPIGGVGMVLGWLLLALAGFRQFLRPS